MRLFWQFMTSGDLTIAVTSKSADTRFMICFRVIDCCFQFPSSYQSARNWGRVSENPLKWTKLTFYLWWHQYMAYRIAKSLLKHFRNDYLTSFRKPSSKSPRGRVRVRKSRATPPPPPPTLHTHTEKAVENQSQHGTARFRVVLTFTEPLRFCRVWNISFSDISIEWRYRSRLKVAENIIY